MGWPILQPLLRSEGAQAVSVDGALTPHPFPDVQLEDRGHGRGVGHVAMPNGSWVAIQHDHDQAFVDAVLDEWWKVWEAHSAV